MVGSWRQVAQIAVDFLEIAPAKDRADAWSLGQSFGGDVVKLGEHDVTHGVY